MAIPRTESTLVIWLKTFTQGFTTHGPALNFTASEIAAVQADAAMLEYLITDLIPSYKSAIDARYSYKDLIKNGPAGAPGGAPPPAPVMGAAPATVAPGVLPRLRQLIQRIRYAPGYTEDIGKELGIEDEGGGNEVDMDTVKPTAKATALTGHQVRITFDKRRFDGVWIESRRKGDADWTPLGVDLYSPYLDARAPVQASTPEIREYRLRFYDGDAPVGQWSDIISVTTIP